MTKTRYGRFAQFGLFGDMVLSVLICRSLVGLRRAVSEHVSELKGVVELGGTPTKVKDSQKCKSEKMGKAAGRSTHTGACVSSNMVGMKDGRRVRMESVFVLAGDWKCLVHEIGHAAFDAVRYLRVTKRLPYPAGLDRAQKRLWLEEKHLEIFQTLLDHAEIVFTA